LGIPADSQTIINDSIARVNSSIDQGNILLQREDVQLSKLVIQSKEEEIKSIRAEGKPVISSYFSFYYQGQFNNFGDVIDRDYWSKSSFVGISTSLSLFDGHRRKSRVGLAQSQLLQLKYQNEQTKQFANTEWLTATETLRKDQFQYNITLKNLRLAERVFESRKSLYAEGVTTLV